MPTSPSFVDHALDLLSLLGPVRARAMFGGHGIYAGDVMFALLVDDELFLKADELCRPRFVEAGCPPFVYASSKGPMEMAYHRPPDDAHEDAEAMLPWARLALDAALRAAAAKAAREATRAKGTAKRATPRRATKARRAGSETKARRAGGATPTRRAAAVAPKAGAGRPRAR